MERRFFRNSVSAFGLLGIVIIGSLSACTRDQSSRLNLRLSIPGSQDNSSLNSAEKLTFVLINLRPATNPLVPPAVFDFEMQGTLAVAPGGSVDLIIDKNIPAVSNLMVQYLGVFENSVGLMRMAYGDTVVDGTRSGEIVANISASMFGSAAKQGEVAGRYFNSPTGGPSGEVGLFFQPPNGKPVMEIERREMVNGYFTAFFLDTIPFTYRMIGTGEVIFQATNLASSVFDTANSNSYLVKFNRPVTYYRESRGEGFSETRVSASTDYILGFFKNANGPANLQTTYSACYKAGVELIEDVFTNDTLSAPLAYRPSSAATMDFRRMGTSGLSHIATPCALGTPFVNRLDFNPQLVSQRDGDAFGFNGAFTEVDPEARFGRYVKAASKTDTGVAIELKWKYLPGVLGVPAHVAGATVFIRKRVQGAPEIHVDDRDLPHCGVLDQFGYQRGPDVTTESYVFTNSAGGGLSTNPGDDNAMYNFNFAICPYRIVAGERRYYKTYAESGCLDGCDHERIFRFGRKVPGEPGHDLTLSANTNYESLAFGGFNSRIAGVDSSGALTTSFTFLDDTEDPVLTVGSEVLLHVTSASTSAGNSACGGQAHEGRFTFSRVVAVDTGANVAHIPKGTFIDSLSNNYLTAPASASDHCYVQMVKVPHFGDLTLATNTALSVGAFDGTSPNGGGIIALRASGTLRLTDGSSVITASGKGFGGSILSGYAGFGPTGIGGQLAGLSGGLIGGGPGGGGGGGANSGNGGLGGAPSGLLGGLGAMGYGPPMGGYFFPALMPGGGGGSGSDDTSDGGNGGGVIFIAARQIDAGSGGEIVADGLSGLAGTGKAGGGGGAGGSITLISKGLINTPLDVSAVGGAGAADGSLQVSGGGGGGGLISMGLCSTGGINAYKGGGARSINTSGENAVTGTLSQNGMDGSVMVQAPYFCP